MGITLHGDGGDRVPSDWCASSPRRTLPQPTTRPASGRGRAPGASQFISVCGYNQIMQTDLLKRITVEPGKCGGKPCIRGQRIRVSDILDLLASGASFEEILRDYAFLERDDILAALAYAARQTDHVVLRTT